MGATLSANVSQASVATPLTCGAVWSHYTNLDLPVKELWKSVNVLAKLWTRVSVSVFGPTGRPYIRRYF